MTCLGTNKFIQNSEYHNNVNTTAQDLEVLTGLYLCLGLCQLPGNCAYLENDTRCAMVADNMSCSRYRICWHLCISLTTLICQTGKLRILVSGAGRYDQNLKIITGKGLTRNKFLIIFSTNIGPYSYLIIISF